MFTPTPVKTQRPASLDSLDAAFAAFRQTYPAYDSTAKLDELRATEYARLDRQGQVYLDYTGGGLYAESQLRDHLALLGAGVFGNPHSKNLTSLAMTGLVEQARAYVLQYFNASPDEYMVIFTPNATGALKLFGEAYPFGPGDTYLLTFDNHNSMNGIREFARAAGATVTYLPVVPPELRADADQVAQALATARPGTNNLFAYPAQSNFTGVQHPLDWIAQAQAQGWDVLLDAAAFAPSNRLDLGCWHPDFVALSFYKIFGYPTGTGCLLARKAAAHKLRRPWYAEGTITFSSVVAHDHYLTPGPAGFEDGTVNYLSLPAVEIGLKFIEAIGIDLIHTRVMCLTGWLLERLRALHYSNGQPLLCLYGPAGTDRRGGTIQVNFLCGRSTTATGSPCFASMGQPVPTGAGARSRSISWIGRAAYATVPRWSIWRTGSAFPCGQGVTVIRGHARSPSALPQRTCVPAFGTKTAAPSSSFNTLLTARQRARCAPRWAWQAPSPMSINTCNLRKLSSKGLLVG